VALITAGGVLGYDMNPGCLFLPGILGVTLFQSGFTGFCPVYCIPDRACPTEQRDINARRVG